MIICSALYYPGSLEQNDLIIRDNRWYPAKYSETFPVWWQYLRKHYSQTHVVLFCDQKSPISAGEVLFKHLKESFSVFQSAEQSLCDPYSYGIDVVLVDEFCDSSFRAMQRNLVKAINLAYNTNQSLLWIDSDLFFNTDLTPIIGDSDVAAVSINHQQFTMGSVLFYISSERLHQMDQLFKLPDFLNDILNNGSENFRMHTLQESGLYKLFCFGKVANFNNVNLSHLSNYKNFMRFLRENPLESEEYKSLLDKLTNFDFTRIPNVETDFLDMLNSEKEGVISG